MPSNSVYLHDIPLQDAWDRFIRALEQAALWNPLEAETVPLDRAYGRVTAEAVWAEQSSPHYHAAAMDGYAILAADTIGASDRTPIDLTLQEQAVYVDTGDLMPSLADAVVPIEHVELITEAEDTETTVAIRLRAALAPWSHVRPMGEDMVKTELVLPSGHTLRPVDLGALAASGHSKVRVWRRPRVAIIPTGTELVEPGEQVEPGQIIEYNSLILAAQVEGWGGDPNRHPSVPDDVEAIRDAVSVAANDNDLVLVIAGSSAGSEDFTAQVIQSLGTLLVHGVAVRPGHPVILGMITSDPSGGARGPNSPDAGEMPSEASASHGTTPVIGVPGYPVSAALTGEIFVEPLLARWTARAPSEPQVLNATFTRKLHSSLGDDEYVRVTVAKVGDQVVAAPLQRGAGVITSLVRADGIVCIPAGVQGIQAGESVKIRLYRPPAEIERTILILGSHDLTIDLMAEFLAPKGRYLSSANLGSVGGLIALRRGEAHLAGSHLLDPASGEYNLAYIDQYMPEIPALVVGLVHRQQGLLVASGNPKGLHQLGDLAREDVIFINRQRGAGTRILLDYHLEEIGLQPDSISGYDHEEYSHLTVAAAVASGRVDCGLGILAAATALGIDFIPLYHERYDLVIPRVHYESPMLEPLLNLLHDREFRIAVQNLPGYDTGPMGSMIAEVGGKSS